MICNSKYFVSKYLANSRTNICVAKRGLSFVEHELFVMQIWGFILCKYKGISIFTVAIYALLKLYIHIYKKYVI